MPKCSRITHSLRWLGFMAELLVPNIGQVVSSRVVSQEPVLLGNVVECAVLIKAFAVLFLVLSDTNSQTKQHLTHQCPEKCLLLLFSWLGFVSSCNSAWFWALLPWHWVGCAVLMRCCHHWGHCHCHNSKIPTSPHEQVAFCNPPP